MKSSIAARGLGAVSLCAIAAGCATVAPVPYAEMASSAYLAPDTSDQSGRVPYRYSTAVERESSDHLKLKGCLIGVLCQTQTWQQTLDVQPGQLTGLTGDLNGPHADKEWAAVPAAKATQAKAK